MGWKARCLQTGDEIRYLSCQLKWTRQMYFWLKLKSWALSGCPQRCCQMHSVCLTKRHPYGHLSQAVGSNNSWEESSLQGLPESRGPIQGSNTDLWKWERNDSFLPFPTYKHPHCPGRVLERKWMELSPLILVCKSSSHLKLADRHAPKDTVWAQISFSHYGCWDLSSHWTCTTPKRSGLYVSRRHTGESHQRAHKADF